MIKLGVYRPKSKNGVLTDIFLLSDEVKCSRPSFASQRATGVLAVAIFLLENVFDDIKTT